MIALGPCAILRRHETAVKGIDVAEDQGVPPRGKPHVSGQVHLLGPERDRLAGRDLSRKQMALGELCLRAGASVRDKTLWAPQEIGWIGDSEHVDIAAHGAATFPGAGHPVLDAQVSSRGTGETLGPPRGQRALEVGHRVLQALDQAEASGRAADRFARVVRATLDEYRQGVMHRTAERAAEPPVAGLCGLGLHHPADVRLSW